MTEENPTPIKKVDEDWKKRAAEEKAKLQPAKAAAAPPAGAGEAGPAGSGPSQAAQEEPPPQQGGRRRGGPFEMLVTMLVQQATMMLGMVPDPMTGERYQDIAQARLMIDMLTTLKTKTKGNLTADEDRFLSGALGELQMEFVALAEEMQKRARPPRKG